MPSSRSFITTTADAAGAVTLTAYELRNLVAHLAAAGRAGDVHRLLALQTGAGTDFWFEVKDDGDPGGYVTDVRLALRLVRDAVDGLLRAGEPAPEVALEIRYALLIASVRSAVGRVPPTLFAALVEHGLRTPEEVLAELAQAPAGVRHHEIVASLAAHLPDWLRRQWLREILLDLPRLDAFDRGEMLVALTPHLPAELVGEALRAIRAIDWPAARGGPLLALAPRIPADLRDVAAGIAAELPEPALRIAAGAALGLPVTVESLRAALHHDSNTAFDVAEAAKVLGDVLPAGLLPELLTVAVTVRTMAADVLIALAPRLPDHLLATAVDAIAGFGSFDHAGAALAALAPHLSGALLERALGVARGLDEVDRIRAGTELALRLPEDRRDEVLHETWRLVEGEPLWELERRDAVVRLAEVLPAPLLPSAERFARSLPASEGGAVMLVAIGARLAGTHRQEVLRTALRDTLRFDDEELGASLSLTSLPVLGDLARLLPGEVLPFVLEHRDPHESSSLMLDRLGAISPHLRASELRSVLRAVRELDDGSERCAAIAALAGQAPEPAKRDLLREALSDCRRIHRQWDRTMALDALAPELTYEMGEEALEIAESIQYEPGARARAAVAGCLPPSLHARCLAGLPVGYERWGAVARAALARTAPEPARTELFRKALAVIGITDWDDTEALSARFVASIAADLPEHLLDEAVHVVEGYRGLPDDRWPAFATLAGRFGEPRRSALLADAIRVAAEVAREPARVRAVIALGVDLPGAARVIRRVSNRRWQAVGLAHLGESVSPEMLDGPADDEPESDDAILELLPFQPPGRASAVLRRLRSRPGWPDHAMTLAHVLPRLHRDLLPDLLDLLVDVPAAERPRLLIALMELLGPARRHHLPDLWKHARAAFDDGDRTQVLEAVTTLAPLVADAGGSDAATETAAAVLVVGRWHP
jgi:hypothetical protein